MLLFNKYYAVATTLLFITEVLIAMFVHDNFVRPYIGDILVVILLYTFVKTFTNLTVLVAAILVGCVAVAIEIAQYFHFIKIIGLENAALAKAVLGNTFLWYDLLCYAIGMIVVIVCEKLRNTCLSTSVTN